MDFRITRSTAPLIEYNSAANVGAQRPALVDYLADSSAIVTGIVIAVAAWLIAWLFP